MNRTTTMTLALVAVLAAAGCNKGLIKEQKAQIADLESRNHALEGELEEQKKMTDDLNTQLADLQTQQKVLIEEKDGLTQITLDGSASFNSADATLTHDGKETVDRIWSVLQNYPDRRILIEGHADNRPIGANARQYYASNWELSSARAHSVLHYVENKYGTEPERLAAVGYGEFAPVADNETREGRAQNRRVVITVGSKMAIQQRQIQAHDLNQQSTEPVTQ
ncbi:MAG TPA: OmpA family protein [Steroidobacteraceae bacterium]|jgi:chemotaxis protein MotB|nr:OmpA family protein [Steroidobacteraceae bacterium]HXS10323.1 OmpA family protein [Candidatus Krumholzibacteria bacterium]